MSPLDWAQWLITLLVDLILGPEIHFEFRDTTGQWVVL